MKKQPCLMSVLKVSRTGITRILSFILSHFPAELLRSPPCLIFTICQCQWMDSNLRMIGRAFYHCAKGHNHRHLRNIDCLSFVMCLLLAPVLIVIRILFFFFCCSHLQNYWSKQGRRYTPLSSLYFLDVYGHNLSVNNKSHFVFKSG